MSLLDAILKVWLYIKTHLYVYKQSIEIFIDEFQIYLAKEALVQLAEDDHQNELEKINEQIESQNVENINAAIMNCKLYMLYYVKI